MQKELLQNKCGASGQTPASFLKEELLRAEIRAKNKEKFRSRMQTLHPTNLVAFGLLLLCSCRVLPSAEANCDKTFLSTGGVSQLARQQKFEAPNRLSTKPYKIYQDDKGNSFVSFINTSFEALEDSQKQQRQLVAAVKPLHCLYKFIGQDDERVSLSFKSFRLRGDEPECSREYVDVYVRFKPEDKLEELIGQELPNGRFCTTVEPLKTISLHNMIVLAIYTELDPPLDGKPLFSGSFEFFKSKVNDQIGPPESGTLCAHTINSANKREGEFQSITYPGAYVKNLRCSYKFVGEPNQRIRLEFLDLDLYSGGPHCPIDSIKIFDGLEETDPLIQTICGSHRSLIIFSTRENLLVTFTTLQRESEIQNRGFSAYFEFSDKFYDPSFIQGPNAKHVRGSECDQRILSNKSTRGVVVSPESKNHPNAVCRYIFEGLQTSLDYEKVLLKFTEFDLKTPRFQSLATTTTQQPPPQQVDSNNTTANATAIEQQCPDNYVRLYTSEQKPDQKQDPNDYDYVLCTGSEIPSTIESDAASMLMEYNSGSIGGYFKAEYQFIDDFRIPGQQDSTESCTYSYSSSFMRNGTFNSPRYPSWYINDMNCSYTFMVKNDEALLLQFNTFKMANSFNEKIIGHNEACKGEDRVEIHELTFDASEQKVIDQYEIGSYCGTTAPGPLLSFKPVRVDFRTNKDQVHYGFGAAYNFYPIAGLKTNEFVSHCGNQIHAGPRAKNGTILSPPTYRSATYEKRNHICSWNITARPAHKIQLEFNRFQLEGSLPVRGCAPAAVRLETNHSKVLTELCGILPTAKYVSEGEWLGVTFISTKQASGSDGFLATWSEIKQRTS